MLDYYTLQATLEKLTTAQHTYTPTDIATLCRAGKLTPLFAYNRFITYLKPFSPNEGGYHLDEEYITPLSGYLTHMKALELLDGYNTSIMLASAFVYQAEGYDTGESIALIDEDITNVYRQNYLVKPIEITKQQLLFPRAEVEALADKQKTSQPKEDKSQGDTLLILGAVMESIKEVAKPNYTQESLIHAILAKYGNTSGISESTLKKKFPEAKNYLKQRFNP